MLVYILKFSACLAIFLAFYKFFLERENMHRFKRFYLLSAVAIALSIPLITFTRYVEPTITNGAIQTFKTLNLGQAQIAADSKSNLITILLWSTYAIGVLFFGIKFILNLTRILIKIKHNPKYKLNQYTNVLLQEAVAPHTFFNFIFLNKKEHETRQIPEAVLLHEQAHAKQKHSIDILGIELLQVIFWFNPLLYFTKHTIKLNHEFLADKAVLDKGVNTSNYQQLLLAFSSNAPKPLPTAVGMANAFNYSSIKKRFTIMKTQTSKQTVWLRSFLLLPLLAITLYSFSEKKEVSREVLNNNKTLTETTYEQVQQKATAEELAEYNKLAKHCNKQIKKKGIIKHKDVVRIKQLYALMSTSQKKTAEAFPDFSELPPPPPPPAPKAQKAPKAPKSIKIVQTKDLPPPPPIPANATPEQKKKYKKTVENYKKGKPGKVTTHNTAKPVKIEVVEIPDVMDVPPPPKSPVQHAKAMAKKGAQFYYESKPVSSEKAIKLLKSNKKLNIATKESNSKKPKVYITSKPIVIED